MVDGKVVGGFGRLLAANAQAGNNILVALLTF